MSDYPGLTAFAAGVAAHVLYFNRGEHHMYGVRYVQAFITVGAASILLLTKGLEQDLQQAAIIVALRSLLFLSGLYSSLLIYRIFLNPLNKFPGPFGARISNFWLSFYIGTSSHALFRVQELHRKYGPYVHIGSNDMSIADPEFVHPIYGHGSKCNKAAWYEQDWPLTSMHTSRSRAMHDKRRRIWSPAFSDKALREYESRVEPYVDALVRRMESFNGEPVNVAKWFNFFGYDVMGDLAFGRDFGMLSSGEEHFSINLLNEGMQPLALLLPPWFFRVLTAIPGLAAGYWKFVKYCSQQLEARMKTTSEHLDLLTPLVEPYKKVPPKGLELTYLQGDSRLVIVAGSDTTSATLVYMFYHLVQHPDIVAKAREEIKPLIGADGRFNYREAAHADYINGIINEALRLHPPVPSAVQRITPPEGLQVGETYIPGNVTVWCPQYALGHSEKAYVDPESFIPERWSTKPELIKNKNAFFPFSLGTMGCIGRPLAMMELRCALAKLLMAFDIQMAPGEDGTNLIQKGRDHFTMETGPLELVFKPRAT